MDMQVVGITRDSARDVKKGEEMLALEVEWVDAIVDIKGLENDGKAFTKLD
jgi:hypothetical protein